MVKPPKPFKKKNKMPPKIEKIYKEKDKRSKKLPSIVTADSPKPIRKAIPTPNNPNQST